jgi:serine/threonine protein kinase
MAVGTVNDFLVVLERSKLLKPVEFAEAGKLSEEITDPTTFAKTLVRQNKLTRWQAGQILAGRGAFFLGKYKLLEMLGKGGMGSVFLGEHVMMNRRVALKIIPRHIGKDPAGLQRFLVEARTIAALDHPNIVQAYSVDNEGDIYYLVMEYVDGLDLQRLVEAEGPLDCPSTVDYVRQAADGLAHAHSRKMVHCDIKPSNLIVNPNGVVKILDMGLARLAGHGGANGEAAEKDDEQILGSVDYMAPEQALRSADFDHRADIYSLGCTLYFLLTGHAPFPEGTLPERILKHQNQEPKPLSVQRSDVPQSLVEICKKMMAKRPVNRFQTAAEVSQMLASWRPGEKTVQRVLQLKKAQPIDELPGPDLLGLDLSNMLSKGVGISSIVPIKSRKPPSTFKDKMRESMPFAFGTTQRMLLTICIVILFALSLLVGSILFLNRSGSVTTAQGGNEVVIAGETPNNGGGTQPREAPLPPKPEEGDKIPQNGGGETQGPPEPPKPIADKGEEGQTLVDTGAQQTTSIIQPQVPSGQEQTGEQSEKPETENIEPLKELAANVELPEITKGGVEETDVEKTVSLGKVVLPPDGSLQLVLIGGHKAVMGTDSIVIQKGASNSQPMWRFYVQSSSGDGVDPPRKIEIAHLTLNNENLTFNWTANVTHDIANALRKCGLIAVVQSHRQYVQLCRPKQAKPLIIDLDKGTAETSVQMDSPMEQGDIIVQITDRPDPFPPNILQPSDTIDVRSEEKNEISMIFPDEKLNYLKVEISAKVRKKDHALDIKAVVKAPALYTALAIPALEKYTIKENGTLLSRYLKKQSNTQAIFDGAREGSRGKNDAAKLLAQWKIPVEFMQGLDALYPVLNKQGKIHYRVYLQYGKYKVELYNTQVPAADIVESKNAKEDSSTKSKSDAQSKKPPRSTKKSKP